MANETKTQTRKDIGRYGYRGDGDAAVLYQGHRETIPMLLGKMAAGTVEPCMTGAPGDMDDHAESDGSTGIAVFRGRVTAPAEALRYLAANPAMRAKLVCAGVLAEAVR